MKPAVQNPSEVDRGSGSVRRRKIWPLLLIIFSVLGLLAGVLMGVIYFSQCARVYQSKATIAISPRQKNAYTGHDPQHGPWQFSIRHDQLIVQDNILTMCLIKYGLRELETLRDFPDTDQIKEIQDNFVVSQNPDEPTQYLLKYFSPNPRDAQTVLATIIVTYEKHLDEKYRSITADTSELLKKMSDKFHVEVKVIDKKLQKARSRAEDLSIAGNPEHAQRLVAELMKKIDLGRGQLAEWSADLRRSEAALKNGREACLEHIWILEEADKINRNSLQVRNNVLELSVEMKLVEELESQRDKLDAADDKLGPGNAAIEALNLAIDSRKEKVKELTSEGAEVLAIGPEQIIRRFAVSVKQKIGDLRSTLDDDLATYQNNYERAVKAERALKEVDELLSAREEMVKKADIADKQFIAEMESPSSGNLHKGYIFETTQPAYRGLEVWPVLPEIIAASGLIGLLLGLGFGCLVVFVSKAFSLARA